MNEEIIRYDDVSVYYGDVKAVGHVSADIHCGSLMAIVGPNGAGKSTLLRATLGWLPLTTGRITLGDDHIEHQRPRLAYVPQRLKLDWDFPATVRMVVEQGRYPLLRFWRGFTKKDHALVDAALEEMGLDKVQNRQIGELSGGQQQKVFLARALAQGADIFLLDEPFEGLDATAMDGLVQTLRSWHGQHRTILAVVHDHALVRTAFDQAMLLNTDLVAMGKVAEVMSSENLERAYPKGTPHTTAAMAEGGHVHV